MSHFCATHRTGKSVTKSSERKGIGSSPPFRMGLASRSRFYIIAVRKVKESSRKIF